MRIKTTIYLSIIITSFLVGKFFNPLPLSNYAFYIIVVALFVPYFGKIGCLKIIFFLSTFTLIQDIPFYITLYEMWPSIYQGIFTGVFNITPDIVMTVTPLRFHPYLYPLILDYMLPFLSINHVKTFMAIQGSGLTQILLLLGGFYFGILNAFYALTKTYKKIGVYKRISF